MTQKLYIILGKADDNDEEILLKSGYMSEYQPTRHLWTPLNIDENETLTPSLSYQYRHQTITPARHL